VAAAKKTESDSSGPSVTYRITYDKDKNKWIVKGDGAQRALASYNTKAEAEARVNELLSRNKNARKSVHKKDGKFQKQR
jgi:hypothetical protein